MYVDPRIEHDAEEDSFDPRHDVDFDEGYEDGEDDPYYGCDKPMDECAWCDKPEDECECCDCYEDADREERDAEEDCS